jgi:hypothetical protein
MYHNSNWTFHALLYEKENYYDIITPDNEEINSNYDNLSLITCNTSLCPAISKLSNDVLSNIKNTTIYLIYVLEKNVQFIGLSL